MVAQLIGYGNEVEQAIRLLHSLPVPHNHPSWPGPVEDGKYRERFGEIVAWQFRDKLQGFPCSRLLDHRTESDIKNDKLSFVHLDLALRNMLRHTGGQICILDQSPAGYFARYFAYVVIEAAAMLNRAAITSSTACLMRFSRIRLGEREV